MQDMMHCLLPSIPERHRAQLRWQQQQERNSNNNGLSNENFLSIQGDGWPNYLTSCAPYPIGNTTREEEMGTTTTTTTTITNPPTTTPPNSSSSKKKRKAGKPQMDDEVKRMKKGDEGSEGEKKQASSEREEEAGESSKENDEMKKVDYIHVRARRGQATDSHSLAERVRRERISERMKYLQGLVPGCDKVTGKAGMLDEIINYVQSLQRQVEFLSMKLASVNPRPDFDMETALISKEMMNNMMACTSPSGNNPSTSMGMQVPEMMLDPSLLLQLNSMHQSMAGNSVDLIALQRTISVPEPFTLHSCFNGSASAGWDNEVHNLSGVEFQQGRGPVFPFHSLQGNLIPNNPKMEM